VGTTSLILLVVGVLILVAGYVLRPIALKRMDTVVRVGGYDLAQLKTVRRAVVWRGRLPADPDLHDVSRAYARQAAQNFPLSLWSLVFVVFGGVLGMVGLLDYFASRSYLAGLMVLGMIVAVMLLSIFAIGMRLLGWRNALEIVRAAS
jgi:uncharacterized membrane protein